MRDIHIYKLGEKITREIRMMKYYTGNQLPNRVKKLKSLINTRGVDAFCISLEGDKLIIDLVKGEEWICYDKPITSPMTLKNSSALSKLPILQITDDDGVWLCPKYSISVINKCISLLMDHVMDLNNYIFEMNYKVANM